MYQIPFLALCTVLLPLSLKAETTPAASAWDSYKEALSNTQNTYSIPKDAVCRINKQEKKTICTDNDGKRITGKVQRFAEGKLIMSYEVKNGLFNGKALRYYLTDLLYSEKNYDNGVLEGDVKTYYENGVLMSVIPYKNGSKEGVAKYYYEDGNLQGQGIYINNKSNGAFRFYAPNGTTSFDFTMENDKIAKAVCYDTAQKPTSLPDFLIKGLNAGCIETASFDLKADCLCQSLKPADRCSLNKKDKLKLKGFFKSCASKLKATNE